MITIWNILVHSKCSKLTYIIWKDAEPIIYIEGSLMQKFQKHTPGLKRPRTSGLGRHLKEGCGSGINGIIRSEFTKTEEESKAVK
jgi:hypothetical protein